MQKRAPGRPKGAKNKAPKKLREVVLHARSYEVLHNADQPPSPELGTYLQLEALLQREMTAYWTDARVLEAFATDDATTELEDKCHFYSSSKGRIVVDDGSLHECMLFSNNIDLSSDFLEHYLHNYDDISNYGDFVARSVADLRHRARMLQNKNMK